jgi:single-stranded DNA-binding protein
MNALTMTGDLTRDPELIHAGERPICRLRLAVDNGRHPTTYIDVSTFDEHAFACAEFLHKGRKVGVSGRLALDEWRNASDKRRQRYRVIGRVEFLDRPKSGGVGDRQPEPRPSDHIDAAPAVPGPALAA